MFATFWVASTSFCCASATDKRGLLPVQSRRHGILVGEFLLRARASCHIQGRLLLAQRSISHRIVELFQGEDGLLLRLLQVVLGDLLSELGISELLSGHRDSLRR